MTILQSDTVITGLDSLLEHDASCVDVIAGAPSMSDLAISKQTKKMLLFVSPLNPFWRKALNAPTTQNNVAKFIDVGHGTISTWKNGITINASTAHEVFSETERKIKASRNIEPDKKTELLEILRKFSTEYANDEVSIYETGKMLGMNTEECQKIIDEVIYRRAPVFPGIYYSTPSVAEEYLAPYKGVFNLWVLRKGVCLQCSLRVRYVLEIGVGFAIRAKLNFPIIEGGIYSSRAYWEYDGFLVRRPNRIFWLFEKRQRDRNDHFYFITGTGRAHQKLDDQSTKVLTLAGTYLTTGQDELQTVVSEEVILQKIDTNNEDVMLKFMHENPRLITDDDEIKQIILLNSDFKGNPVS